MIEGGLFPLSPASVFRIVIAINIVCFVSSYLSRYGVDIARFHDFLSYQQTWATFSSVTKPSMNVSHGHFPVRSGPVRWWRGAVPATLLSGPSGPRHRTVPAPVASLSRSEPLGSGPASGPVFRPAVHGSDRRGDRGRRPGLLQRRRSQGRHPAASHSHGTAAVTHGEITATGRR